MQITVTNANHGFYDLFPQKQVQLIVSVPYIEIIAG